MADVGTILWAKNRPKDHGDHLHVEPPKRMSGTPPLRNPGMSVGVTAIFASLEAEFGNGEYFLDPSGRYVGNDPGVHWTHMGGWNRRKIAGSPTWSQHAWWNALDIGPYIGVSRQQRFYDFLAGSPTLPIGDDMITPAQFASRLSLEQVDAIVDAKGPGGVWVISPTSADRNSIKTYYKSILNQPDSDDWESFFQEVVTEGLVNAAIHQAGGGGGSAGPLSITLTGTARP